MDNLWKEYEADFNSLSDAEIEAECVQEQTKMGEAESWLEAVASWKAAGCPRNGESPDEQSFVFNIAMDIRAYGFVTVTAHSLGAAQAKLTAEFIAENFSPHGSGSDDLDYNHPSDIVVTLASDEITCDTIDEFVEFEVPDGSWITPSSGA